MEIYEKLVNTDTGFEIPIGEKLERTEFLVDILRKMGFEVKRGKASHIVTLGDPPYVTLIGHLDTVFKKGEPQRRPFKVEGNLAMGPGVADMKGGIVVMLEALKRFLENGGNLSFEIVLNVDEEIGSPDGRVDHYEAAERSWFCLSFETGRKDGNVVVGRKGIAKLYVKVAGKSGHASMPESGANALLEMADKVLKINALSKGDLTVTPTIFSSGYKVNVIPDEAEAYFDVRYSDMEQIKDLRIKLEDLFHTHLVNGTAASYSIDVRRPPMKTLDTAIEVLEEAKRRSGQNVKGIVVSGGGDASFYTEKGIPAIDGLGIVGRWIHSPDEVAFLDTFEERVKLTLSILEVLKEWKD